jgi:hypothetical protein
MRLITLHTSLFRYIISEFPKQKTVKDKSTFIKKTIKSYVGAIKAEWQQFLKLFNKEYLKQKAEYEKHQQIQKDLQRALKLLEYLDVKMEKMGYNRTTKRQFWRDFSKNGKLRKELFEELIKEVNMWR